MPNNNTYNDGGLWNRLLNSLPKDQRRDYKEKNIAQVNRQYIGTPMFRILNIYANTHSPVNGHPWIESAVSTANLLGHWTFNEGTGNIVYNSVGNDNGTWSGTEAGTSGYYSPGITAAWAGTFSQDGTTRVTITPIGELAGDTSKTLSVWFNDTNLSSTTSEQDVVAIGTDATAETFGIAVKSGYIYAHFGGNPDLNTHVLINSNTWYFAAVTYDSSTTNAVAYVNGNIAAFEITTLNTGNTNFFIGQHLTNPGSFFPGYIDDVRVYDATLSASNISDIYNGLA